jgi:hypothetical protein
MSSIWIELEVNGPKAKEKVAQVNGLLEARVQRLRESISLNRVESVSSVTCGKDAFFGHDRWRINFEGDGDISEYAKGIHSEIESILDEGEKIRVTIA